MLKFEKCYFLLDVKKSGCSSSCYLDFFKAINWMEVYEEEKL